jgi:hypothetical protein
MDYLASGAAGRFCINGRLIEFLSARAFAGKVHADGTVVVAHTREKIGLAFYIL